MVEILLSDDAAEEVRILQREKMLQEGNDTTHTWKVKVWVSFGDVYGEVRR
jgi:hypothetical protein